MFVRFGLSVMFVALVGLAIIGCSEREKPAPKKDGTAKAPPPHEGWWCNEHGVPEDICSLCSEEAAAKMKKEGDWCKIHERAQSQCFKCDPSKYARFEAMYEKKFDGKKPPRPPEEEFKK